VGDGSEQGARAAFATGPRLAQGRAVRPQRRARVLRRSGATFLLAFPVVAWWAVLARDAPRFVLGDVAPAPALIGPAAAAIGSLLVLCGLLTEPAAPERVDRPGSRRRFVGTVVRAGKTVVLAVAWGSAVVAFVAGITADARVLAPASVGGCRVVVVQEPWGGSIMLLPRGAIRPHRVGGYSSNGGYGPVTHGTYRMRWTGETAVVEVWGSASRPVWQDHGDTFDCSTG